MGGEGRRGEERGGEGRRGEERGGGEGRRGEERGEREEAVIPLTSTIADATAAV